MTKDEALKLALSVLDEVRSETFRLMRNGQKFYAEEKVWNAIFVIKKALAEQPAQQDMPKIGCVNHDCDKCKAQEPVAWMHPDGRIWTFGRGFDKSTFTIPLYTTLPQRTWQGLTEEERAACWNEQDDYPQFAAAIEAKLKEKNHG